MIHRMIYLPGPDIQVTIQQYVKVVRHLKTLNPATEVKQTFTCWWPGTVAQMLREFRAGVHNRINNGIPYNIITYEERSQRVQLSISN